MWLVAGIALLDQGLTWLRAEPLIEPLTLRVLAIASGLLLFAGLWTPIIGSVVAILELWIAIAHPGARLASILLATIGAALGLVGPGAWSIDARLFGWKRIDVRGGMIRSEVW